VQGTASAVPARVGLISQSGRARARPVPEPSAPVAWLVRRGAVRRRQHTGASRKGEGPARCGRTKKAASHGRGKLRIYPSRSIPSCLHHPQGGRLVSSEFTRGDFLHDNLQDFNQLK
jgi:hypothetical protein